MRHLHLAVRPLKLAVLAALWAIVLCRPASALDGHDATRLHILIVADTNDEKIGKHCAADQDRVQGTFTGGVPETRRTMTVFSGGQVSPEAVLAYYRGLEVGPGDSLLFYYAGHGVIDPKQGHVLTMSQGNLRRSTLLEAMQQKNARLVILLTDCCSVYAPVDVAFAPPRVDPNVFRYLFFRHQGTVDVTAAKRGTFAYGHLKGGAFTSAFCDTLGNSLDYLDADKDGRLDWPEFFGRVQTATNSMSKHLVRQIAERDRRLGVASPPQPQGQEPEVLGDWAQVVRPPIPKSKWRFGVRPRGVAPDGVRVGDVFDGSPAEWAGLEPGDVLLSIDGAPIRSATELVRTVNSAERGRPFPLVFKVRKARTARTQDVFIKLADSGSE